MPNIGPMELIIVLVIALLILGPGKLPEVGSAFGKTIREFRKASSDIQETVSVSPATTPAATPRPNTLSQPATPVAAADVADAAPRGTPVDPADDVS